MGGRADPKGLPHGRRRTGGLYLLTAAFLTACPPVRLTAQVAPNRATAYLHPTDVRDARALWVNPSGLALVPEASVYAELAVADPGAHGRLRQVNAGFNSSGLSFGYQRDIFDDGRRGHTYRLGIAGGSEGLAGGLAVTRYRGDTKGTSWDLGLAYVWTPGLTVGGVITNIGQPVVRGLEQRLTFIPGATWRPLGPAAALSAHALITPDSVLEYAFGVAWWSVGGGGGGGGWGGTGGKHRTSPHFGVCQARYRRGTAAGRIRDRVRDWRRRSGGGCHIDPGGRVRCGCRQPVRALDPRARPKAPLG